DVDPPRELRGVGSERGYHGNSRSDRPRHRGSVLSGEQQQLCITTNVWSRAQHPRVAVHLDRELEPPPGPPYRQVPGNEDYRDRSEQQQHRIARAQVLALVAEYEIQQLRLELQCPTRQQDG